jgi:signal transduction histidine kinase
LFELLDNAIKFSPPNTPICIRSYTKEGDFYLEVQDQGAGMSQEQISRIDAFTKFHPHRYTHEGLGLGLKTVQKTLEIFGGKLKIFSEEGQGTQVCVRLPLSKDESH